MISQLVSGVNHLQILWQKDRLLENLVSSLLGKVREPTFRFGSFKKKTNKGSGKPMQGGNFIFSFYFFHIYPIKIIKLKKLFFLQLF